MKQKWINIMAENNVVDFKDFKLLKEAGEAIEGLDKIFKEALEHADNPEVKEFLDKMADKMGELVKEMEGLDADIEALRKETEGE